MAPQLSGCIKCLILVEAFVLPMEILTALAAQWTVHMGRRKAFNINEYNEPIHPSSPSQREIKISSLKINEPLDPRYWSEGLHHFSSSLPVYRCLYNMSC